MSKITKQKKPQRHVYIGNVLLKALSAGLQRKFIEDPLLSTEEWRSLLVLASQQTILPLVFEAVYPLLPDSLEHEYRTASIKWITEQVQRTDFFLRIYNELKQEGIDPLVIKGIVCRNTYSLPDWRVSADEDIYIPRNEYPLFHSAMSHIGFQSSPPNYKSEHETIYRSREINIEGHWELFPQETKLWIQVNALTTNMLQRAIYTEIEGTEILTLEPTDHMIYLLLHAMKHFSLSGVGIRQICDVAMWDSKYVIDWMRVRTTMDAFGGTTFSGAVIHAANRYFGMPVPENWTLIDSTDLIKDTLEGGIFGHNTEDRIHSASITASSTENSSSLKSIFRAIFPTRKVMEINYPWVSKSLLLLPLGWIVRLLGYLSSIRKGASPLRSFQIGRQRIRLLKEYGVFQTQNVNLHDK